MENKGIGKAPRPACDGELKPNVYLSSLGCAKNLVESEVLLGRLKSEGWNIISDPKKAEVIIVNTCSFIRPAIEESIDTILELARNKKIGACRKLIVAGCLPERFKEDISESIPEVDFFVGTGAFHKLPDIAAEKCSGKKRKSLFIDPNLSLFQKPGEERLIENNKSVYIKIAEGCDRRCTYCIIPELKGRYKSRPFEDICGEAETLIKNGAEELILIAQETTLYGKDMPGSADLSELLKAVSESALSVSKDIEIRVLYSHPSSIDLKFIETIARTENICSYFDIPVQHASDRILKKMGRVYDRKKIYELVDIIRDYVPDAVLRTSIIVGFPYEMKKDFQELCDFIEMVKFDHLGVFIYSDSEDISSNKLAKHVSEKTALKRYEILMKKQAKISYEKNYARIGEVHNILIEEKKRGLFSGRAWFQAPDIDGIIYVDTENHKESPSSSNKKRYSLGDRIKVKITGASEYDLFGKPL